MEYKNLGRSGLSVSRLCLGTMNFGPHTDESESHAILDRALELGINFIDTANVYGWKMGEGITEQIIGHWFAKGNKRREQVVFATKVYGKMGEGPNQRRFSAYHIRQACEDRAGFSSPRVPGMCFSCARLGAPGRQRPAGVGLQGAAIPARQRASAHSGLEADQRRDSVATTSTRQEPRR